MLKKSILICYSFTILFSRDQNTSHSPNIDVSVASVSAVPNDSTNTALFGHANFIKWIYKLDELNHCDLKMPESIEFETEKMTELLGLQPNARIITLSKKDVRTQDMYMPLFTSLLSWILKKHISRHLYFKYQCSALFDLYCSRKKDVECVTLSVYFALDFDDIKSSNVILRVIKLSSYLNYIYNPTQISAELSIDIHKYYKTVDKKNIKQHIDECSYFLIETTIDDIITTVKDGITTK